MATPPRPTSTNPEDYPAWRAYIAAFTGSSGAKLTRQTREAISAERANAGPGPGPDPGGTLLGLPVEPGVTPVPDPPEEELTPEEQRSREGGLVYLTALLKEYGLESLVSKLSALITEYGFNEDVIMSQLREDTAYKARFTGMENRRNAGFSAINEAQYLGLENQYKKAMRSYGLDSSFYSQESLGRLIGFDVSADEVETRVGTGQRIMQNANQTVLRELQEYYPEITNGDLLSYLLDPGSGQEVLSKKIRTGLIGGTAEQAGFTMDFTASDRLARTSVGQTVDPFDVSAQARLEQTFGTARETARTDRTLAGIDRESYTEMDTLEAAFGDTDKQLASQRRGRRERARFSGESGVGRSSLSRRSTRAL